MSIVPQALKAILIGAALVLGGCATGPSEIGLAPEIEPVSASALASPDAITHEDAFRAYYVGPYDRLVIDVFGFEQLVDKEVQIDSNGGFAFPIAGRIDARGMTLNDVQTEITSRLQSAYVREPQVAVNLKESNSQFVSVDGQVKEPGLYPILGNMTLLKSVASAKGVTEYSQLKDVVLLRTVDGQRYAALYNMDAIRRGNYADPEIYANDIVIVGDSKSRRMFEQLLQTIPALATPLIVALQR